MRASRPLYTYVQTAPYFVFLESTPRKKKAARRRPESLALLMPGMCSYSSVIWNAKSGQTCALWEFGLTGLLWQHETRKSDRETFSLANLRKQQKALSTVWLFCGLGIIPLQKSVQRWPSPRSLFCVSRPPFYGSTTIINERAFHHPLVDPRHIKKKKKKRREVKVLIILRRHAKAESSSPFFSSTADIHFSPPPILTLGLLPFREKICFPRCNNNIIKKGAGGGRTFRFSPAFNMAWDEEREKARASKNIYVRRGNSFSLDH